MGISVATEDALLDPSRSGMTRRPGVNNLQPYLSSLTIHQRALAGRSAGFLVGCRNFIALRSRRGMGQIKCATVEEKITYLEASRCTVPKGVSQLLDEVPGDARPSRRYLGRYLGDRGEYDACRGTRVDAVRMWSLVSASAVRGKFFEFASIGGWCVDVQFRVAGRSHGSMLFFERPKN